MGIHNASHGKQDDLAECRLNLYEKIATRPVTLLREKIEHYLTHNPEKESLIIAHSQGAIQTGLALELISENNPQLLGRVHVLSIAPGSYLPKWISNHIASYRIYCSPRDPIPMIHSEGRKDQRHAIRILDRDPNLKTFDHDHEFNSPTYAFVLSQKINQFIQLHGGLVQE